MVTKYLLILLPITLPCVLSFPKKIKIAGLFDNEDEAIQRTFTSAVRAVNKDRHEKREELPNVYLMQEMPKFETDPFDVELKVCKMLNDEVVGIFGPQEKVISEHVQSICDTMEVPHISVRQDSSASPQPRGLTLNLYPHVSSLSQVYDQLVTEFKWKSFAILYEDTDSLIRMHLLLKRWDAQGNFIFVYHLGYGPNYRQAMQEIKKSEIENLIIDCSYKILDKVLKQAQQVGLLSDKHKVIVTSLDLQTLDLEPYQYSGVNFTGLRLIDPEDPIVQQTVNKHKNEWGLDDPSELRVEPALMYDAVQLFARAFKQLKDATRGDVKKLPCDGSERWEHGLSLSNFMRSTETRGITGLVKFDRDGFRSNIQLDIVRLTENGMMKIGVWNSSLRNIDWIPDINVKKTDVELTLQNQTFIVLISLTPPYGMQTESWTTLSGNERYEGFGIDIIDHISKILGFNYTLQVESNYGSYNEKIGKWSDSPYRNLLNTAILKLSESGIITELKKKWWTQKRGGGKCRENGGTSSVKDLDLENVGGVFLVLMNGQEMLFLYVTVAFMPNILGFPKKIPIGGLFDSDEMIQKAFEMSVEAVNRNITTFEQAMNVSLISKSEKVNKDTFHVANIACELLSSKVAGIFGPQDKSTASHIQSMCDTLDIPHIAARWDPKPKRGNTINLYPHPDKLSMVFYDLVKEYKWKEYAILYDNTDSLIRINRLLKLANANTASAMVFHLGSGPNFRQAMKEVKMSGYRNIIIDCTYDILGTVLEQAQQVGIMSERHRVIITSLDLQTLDLEPYKYSGVNITGIRLIDPESSVVRHTLESQPVKWNLTDGSHLRVEAALAYDAVQLFASGYTRLRDSIKGNLKKLFCNRRETWGHGFSLSNYMRNERIHGLTGMIKFDTAGFRSEFQLDIVTLSNKGLEKIGKWETNLDPYGMLKESASILTGNDRYEGFAVDIIHEMSKILGFNYTLEVQIDNAYGSLNPMTGKWDGMIARLLSGEADLAITDLTITSERESAVDFTSPFMNLGISVLYRKPTSAPPSLLSFLGPFSKEVWLHLIAAYVVVVAVLYIIGRLCPREWKNPYPCIKEPEVFETPFTLEDTPFLVIGAILKAPTGLAPAGISTRALAVAWWFFALIITSTYLANLAAALATKSVVWPFEVAEQLAYQHKIKYGAKKKGSSLNFFKDSSHEPYMIMYKYMMDNADEVLLETNEDGVRKVQQENYAFIMESSTIEYNKQRKCNITQVGGLLDAKGYGIAMRKGVPYRTDLSGAVLKMQESGMMNELQLKWWKQKRGGNVCEEKPPVTVEPLNFEDVGGVFLIMISGVMSSWIFAGLSFLWNIRNNAIKHNVSYKEEFLEELKFLAKCTRKKIVKRCSIETLKSDNTDF
ncbi:hypothetical protein DMN91_002119 [Ooceraea biroi]|uniref:Glutamate receptor, ionotropic kainate n=1 Tax=Ooceraea biroi TaxID=2015173 RepID=A0A3L8E015_OOCBI|nr:hypothetical protein DMN91_002119 [Ooceraea biroi]